MQPIAESARGDSGLNEGGTRASGNVEDAAELAVRGGEAKR